jgi:hypothetical protein
MRVLWSAFTIDQGADEFLALRMAPPPPPPYERDMTFRSTALERAFTLARSGDYVGVAEIKGQLKAEGYSVQQLEGPLLMRQLRELCVASRKVENS